MPPNPPTPPERCAIHPRPLLDAATAILDASGVMVCTQSPDGPVAADQDGLALSQCDKGCGGPIHERAMEGIAAVVADDLRAAHVWPELRATAGERGWAGVVSWPMWFADGTPGALVSVHPKAGIDLDPGLLEAGGHLARVFALHIDALTGLEETRTTVRHLQGALATKVCIEQAKGWLASRDDISPKQAFDRMRQEARATRRPVADLAEEVLVGGLEPRPVWTATQR